MLDLRPRLALFTAALALAGCFNPTGQGASAGSSSGSTADATSDATTTTAGTTAVDPTTGGTLSTTTATSTSETTGTTSTVSTTSETSTSETSTPGTTTTTDPSSTSTTGTSTTDTSDSSTTTTTIGPEGCGNAVVEDGEECDDGNQNNNDTCLANCKLGFCGDGFVLDGVEECDAGPDNAANAPCKPNCEKAFCGDMVTCQACGEQCDGQVGCGLCKWEHLYIFVAAKPVKAGEIGGLAGGDQRCQTAAANSPMLNGRKFVAWLSTSTVNAGSRIGASPVNYLRTDHAKIADGTDDLLDAILSNPISHSENGAAVVDMKPVWTGTLANGDKNGGDTLCGDWTEVDGMGRTGDYTSVSYLWTDQAYVNCDQEGHIYCVQTVL